MSEEIPCGPGPDDRHCPRYWEMSAEITKLRELLDEVGTLAANAPEDDAFSVCQDIAMRIAAHGVPDDGRHPDDCMCDQCRYDRFKQAEAEEADFAPDREDDDGYPDSEADMDALAYQRGEDERDNQ